MTDKTNVFSIYGAQRSNAPISGRFYAARRHPNTIVTYMEILRVISKGKFLPYSLLSVGFGADPGVQAVSPQVTF